MQCSSCGTILSPGILVCPKCGSRTSSSRNPYNDTVSYDTVPYIEQKFPHLDEITEQKLTPVPPLIAAPPPPHVASSLVTGPKEPTYSLRDTPQQPLRSPQPLPSQKPKQRTLRWTIIPLVLLSLLVIAGGIISINYINVVQPAALHVQATAVAHNFLAVQAQGTAQARLHGTATANAAPSPAQLYQQVIHSAPVISDPLRDDGGNVWYRYGPAKGAVPCSFSAGAYHIQAKSGTSYCMGSGAFFENLAFQIDVKVIKGDNGGIMFRVTGTGNATQAYTLFVSVNGTYTLAVMNQQQLKNLSGGASAAITKGLKRTNTLTAIARDSHIYVYINGNFVTSVVDTSYASGQIALIASGGKHPLDVAFNNVKVWGL